MNLKIFKSEIKRNKVINIILYFFITLASLLVSSAIYIIIVLVSGVNQLVDISQTPHFVQMHTGELDYQELNDYNSQYDYIDKFQIVEMIGVDSSKIYFDSLENSEAKSVMDISFVTQNIEFDFLLDLDNEVASVNEGEIGIPIYYMQQKNLVLGDKVFIGNGEDIREFTITSFIRDSQMNPSLVSSKRFLVASVDYEWLATNFESREYLIEYRFESEDDINNFYNYYSSSTMPQTGPYVDILLFKMLNGITDGMIIGILILISMLLVVISILCLRYTLINTIEEDRKEIGVMKAIGLSMRKIKSLYLAKYLILTSAAVISGYFLSKLVNSLLVKNIEEYLGSTKETIVTILMPLLGAIIIFIIVIVSVWIILRRCHKISAVQALTNQEIAKPKININYKLSKSKLNTNYFIGINDILKNIANYLLIIFIFTITVLIMIIPANLFQTVSSEQFSSYMGISKSDLRIDLRIDNDYDFSTLESDKDIEKYAQFSTYRIGIKNLDDEIESMQVEVGDFNSFPLEYIEGGAPQTKNEIALSLLASNNLSKEVGEEVEVFLNGITMY